MIVHEAAFSQTIPSRTMKNKIGLSIIVIGVLHTLLSLMKFSDTFSEIIKEMRIQDILSGEDNFEDFKIAVQEFSDTAGLFHIQIKRGSEYW